MEKARWGLFSLSCQRPLEKEYQMPRVMLSAVFWLQRFIPSSPLNSEGLNYIYLLAEIVTAQAVLITHCAGTGKGMKHPMFSGLHPSHPWLLPSPASTPPPTAGLGAAALRFPFSRGLGGLKKRLALLFMNSCFFSSVFCSFVHCSAWRVKREAPASLAFLGSCALELWGTLGAVQTSAGVLLSPKSVSAQKSGARMLGGVRCLKLGSRGRCDSTPGGDCERM